MRSTVASLLLRPISGFSRSSRSWRYSYRSQRNGRSSVTQQLAGAGREQKLGERTYRLAGRFTPLELALGDVPKRSDRDEQETLRLERNVGLYRRRAVARDRRRRLLVREKQDALDAAGWGQNASSDDCRSASAGPRSDQSGLGTHRIDSQDRRRPSARDRPPRANPPALLRKERAQPESR
jgi:hypothetical protein